MFSWPDGPTFQWGERQWWRFLFYTSGRTRHAGSFHPPHSLSRVSLSLVYLRSHRMTIHTQPLAPPILMHVQLDPVVIYGVLKKVSDFLRRGAPKIPRPCVFLPWFLIRSGLCRSIPLACWDSMGASTWGGGMEMQIRDEVCSLPLIYFRTDPKSISSVSNGGVDLSLFCVAFAFGDLGI